jgi:tetratricopeptide (TPR) repeat protein
MSYSSEIILDYLRTQFERGRAILFTGAGFTATSKNLDGESVPVGSSLAEKIWPLCFPSISFDTNASLQDVYQAALAKDPKRLKELLTRKLSIDAKSIPDYITRYFLFPWHRIYTLNIDNLADIVSQRSALTRPLTEISTTNLTYRPRNTLYEPLPVYHLNGTIADLPENVTFGSSHYAKRLAFPADKLYLELIADIVSRPVVFVGTRLDEPPLWQHVEIRRAKGSRDMREMRPRSYLVTPTLDRAREARLAEFNITWIPMTAEEFSAQILEKLTEVIGAGLQHFKTETVTGQSVKTARLPEVGELSTEPHRQSEFLLGQEPIWADIQSNRAVERACDSQYWDIFQALFSTKDKKNILLITGTAGSGKSTCLMRLALRAAAQGHRIAWVDRANELSPRDIISAMKADNPPSMLAIDDADLFGTSLSSMLLDIVSMDNNPMVVVAIRSAVIDRVIDHIVLKGIKIEEHSVPHLADDDIDALIDTLNRENRLGILKGKPREEQRAKFREYAGRQLLVAMFSATSGARFQEKIPDEYFQLPQNLQRVYAVVALASTFRYRMTRQEILLALDDSTNEALNSIETLLSRHILVEMPPSSGYLQARHRMIAEMVRDELLKRGQIADSIFGLAFVASSYRHAGLPKKHRVRALLRNITNHDFLYKHLDLDRSQMLYQELEDMLSDDSHYWLQRGSLEVEFGDLRLAENFLNQARGLSPNDAFIENEWAYLLFKKALEQPKSLVAQEYVQEATRSIEAVIATTKSGPYPFHVLGSQGLAWSRVGIPSDEDKAKYLSDLKRTVEKGIALYPDNKNLRELRDSLQWAYLSLALSPHQR